ncbi:MAG: glycosyltransferase, partial [Solirubrobacteraceae bacterium]
VHAFAALRERAPELRLAIYGDGPQHAEVVALIDRLGLGAVASAPGFVGAHVVDEALAGALCMVLPSRREGYGMIVVEAAAHGVPSVVVADPDNAATELVQEGVNGFVAPSAAPGDLAAAIARVHAGGGDLRRSTADWFARNARRLSMAASLDRVAAEYVSFDRRGAASVGTRRR